VRKDRVELIVYLIVYLSTMQLDLQLNLQLNLQLSHGSAIEHPFKEDDWINEEA
jgi:hypothetical protein